MKVEENKTNLFKCDAFVIKVKLLVISLTNILAATYLYTKVKKI